MMSDFDKLDVMLGNENNNPIERALADAIEQSSAHEDEDKNTYHRDEYRDLHMKMMLRGKMMLDSPLRLSLTNWTQ